MPAYEYRCDECGSLTEALYLSWRDAPQEMPCRCGAQQGRIPSTFSPDFGAEVRRLRKERKLEIGTRDEIEAHARSRRASIEARFDRQLSEAVGAAVHDWTPPASYAISD